MSTHTGILGVRWSALGSLSYKNLSLVALPRYIASLAAEAFSGQQTPASAFEKLGITTAKRPNGPVLWFHALSVGESAVALPVIFRCLLEYNEHVHVLLTTCTQEAYSLLQNSLPPRVTVQYLPLDNALCMRQFLAHWKPQTCILMESPTWPALVECCAASGVRLALLNARLSSKVFLSWFDSRPRRALLGSMLEHFSLIVPQSDIDVGRFRILGATLAQMPGWCSDLKYAAALGTSVWHLWRPRPARIAALRRAVAGRPIWVAAYTAPGEEDAVASCHAKLKANWPGLITVVVPRLASRCQEVAATLGELPMQVALWSQVVNIVAPASVASPQSSKSGSSTSISSGSGTLFSSLFLQSITGSSNGSSNYKDSSKAQPVQAAVVPDVEAAAAVLKGIDILLVDVLSDLPLMYSVAEIAFVGNSLLEGCGGHNLAEAAVAGCAVLVGEHAGHFNTMADELNQAAVMAAEEAAAAVNSSGPLEDPFAYISNNSGGGIGEQAAATATAAAAAVPQLEGGEASSPRDGSHWGGILEPQQQQPSDASSATAYLQQQPSSRPSTAPAAVAYSQDGSGSNHVQQRRQYAAVGSSSASIPRVSAEADSRSSGAARNQAAASSTPTAVPLSSSSPASPPNTATGNSSSTARHTHAWATYAATLSDRMNGVSGVLSVLGEEHAVLLDGPSLSLPNGSCHIYDDPVAPPPSAANSTPFGGTGEGTPITSSSGGGAATAEQHMQQLDGYFNRVVGQQQRQQQQQPFLLQQSPLVSQDSSDEGSRLLQQRQRQQQLRRRRAIAGTPNSNTSSMDGSGLLLQHQQQQQHMVNGVMHQGSLALPGMPRSPHCPLTPHTPYPTPDDSAQTFGGRSPLSPYQIEGGAEPPHMQLNPAELSTAQQQLLSQHVCRCSWGSGGGAESGRTTADGAAALQVATAAAVPAGGGDCHAARKLDGQSSCSCCCDVAVQQQQCSNGNCCEVHADARPETPQGACAAGITTAAASSSMADSAADEAAAPPGSMADDMLGLLAPALLSGEQLQQQQQQQGYHALLPVLDELQEVEQLQPAGVAVADAAGFFLPQSALCSSEQYEAEIAAEEAAAAELMQRCCYRPSNPSPPSEGCSPAHSLAGSSSSSHSLVHPRAAAAEVGARSGSSSGRVLLVSSRSCSGGGSGSSMRGSASRRWTAAGRWRGGSTGGEPMSATPEAGVIHEVHTAPLPTAVDDEAIFGATAAAAAAVEDDTGRELVSPFSHASAENAAWGAEMGNVGIESSSGSSSSSAGRGLIGRSPTMCELVCCDRSCASSMSAAAPAEDAAATGDSSAEGHIGVDLFPGASRSSSAAAGATAVAAPVDSTLASKEGSIGWEDWGEQQKQQQQQLHEQFCDGCAAAFEAYIAGNSTETNAGSSSGSGLAMPSLAGTAVGPSSLGGASSTGISRLGDPTRSTHYLDLPSTAPSMRLNLPQLSTRADSESNYNQPSSSTATNSSCYYRDASAAASESCASHAADAATLQVELGHAVAGTPGGSRAATAAAGPPADAWGGQQQAAYSAAAYFGGAGRSQSLQQQQQQLELGGATPSSVASGFSPTSTATDAAATPVFNNAWPGQRLAPPTAAAAAAARLARRGSRGHSGMSNMSTLSGMSSLDWGMSRDEGQVSGDGGGWGRLSGADTPNGYHSRFGSEAPTPHGCDADRMSLLKEGAASTAGDLGAAPGTSYLRYRGDYILPATHLPYAPLGPAVWRVPGADGLASAVGTLLREPLERRSRGHAAAQAAAKLASGLVSTVWHVVDDMVVAPALQEYVAAHGAPGAPGQAGRAPTRVLGVARS